MVGAGVILGGATALWSGVSAIMNFQQAKTDAKEAEATAKRLMGMEEVDKMAALQSTDLSKVRLQQTAQQAASATQALQGMGAEAAIGGAANLQQGIAQETAQTTMDQAAMDAQLAQLKAQAAQNLEYRNFERRREIEADRLAGAQKSAADRRTAGLNDLTGVFTGSGMAIQDILAMSNPYGENQI